MGYIEIEQLPQSNSRVQYKPALIVLGPGFKPRYRKKKKSGERGEREGGKETHGGRERENMNIQTRHGSTPDMPDTSSWKGKSRRIVSSKLD